MAKPPTLHREYYRQRSNPQARDGAVDQSCNSTTWNRNTFTLRDVYRSAEENGVRSLYIDGRLRTRLGASSGFDAKNVLNVSEDRPWTGTRTVSADLPKGASSYWRTAHIAPLVGFAKGTLRAAVQRADSGLPTQQLDLSGFTVNSSTTMTLAADEATLTLVPWIGRAVGGAFGAVLQNSQGELAEVTYAEVVVMTDVVSTRCTLSKHALST
eukprot:scaffold128494_cov75-Phaeocystis_antarctica.AAC.1